MASLDDILTTQKNGVVALNGVRTAFEQFLNAFAPTTGTILKVRYTAIASTYTVQTTDCVLNCTSGSFTVTLPSAVSIQGQVFYVRNSGAGTITVDTTGGQTINGTATITVGAATATQLVSTGANWVTL